MTEEQAELARRLVACEQWRWLPGMERLIGPSYGQRVENESHGWAIRAQPDQGLPDLTDDATVGVLLGMLPHFWSATSPSGLPPGEGRQGFRVLSFHSDGRRHTYEGPTLGEACARALLAVWGAE